MKHFVVADASGRILQTGRNLERHIQAKRAAGERVVITNSPVPLSGFRVNAQDQIEPCQVSASQSRSHELRIAIKQELARTDYTQMADAPDHLSADQIAAWRSYRKALRGALAASSASDMLAQIPNADPTNRDPFKNHRRS